jgi:TolB-like protein
VFAFGCMLYEVVAKKPPFDGENPIDVMYEILHKEPEPLPDRSLDLIARRCLAKNPEQRYSSMHEIAADIRGAIETTDVHRVLRFRPRHPRRWLIAVAALLVAIVAAIVAMQGRAPAIDSIAVLPFTGAAPEMEFLGDGMADDIVRDLSRNADLRVIANSSTARYRGAKDPRAVARELNVDAVLMTKMTAGSGLLSLDTQLVRAADGSLLWGSKYARSLGEATALAHEVVSDLSTRARLEVAPQRAQTRNPQAYAAYQRGRQAVQKQTAPSLKSAIEHFHHALELDPDYAQAWAGLAYAHGRQAVFGIVPMAEGLRQEKAEAERAVALDDTLPEAHWYLALVAGVTGDDARYEREMARVLELDPNFAEAWTERAIHLLLEKKFDEAERLYQRARSLDPMSPHVLSSYAAHLTVMRQYDRAASVLFNLTEQFPDYETGVASLALTYSAMGRQADALAQIERANLSANPNFLVWKGIILARAGRTADARAIARQVDDAAKARFFPPYYRAMLSAELGDRDAALTLLEQVRRNGDWQVKWLPFEAAFDSLRGEARFKALIR